MDFVSAHKQIKKSKKLLDILR